MGFPLEACRRAVYFTGNTGIDAATNWIMSHMDDAGETGNKEAYDSKVVEWISTLNPLFSSARCRFHSPAGVAGLQFWGRNHANREHF